MEVITKNPIIVEKKSNVGGEVIKYASPDAEPLSWDRAYFGANGENHSNADGISKWWKSTGIGKELAKAGNPSDWYRKATQMPDSQKEALAKQEKMLQDSLKPSATDEALLQALASKEENKGLSMGAKIGIGVGAGVLLLTIIILVVKSSKK
jgi:hypothetical protein